jgi:hypothetical protein
MKKRTQYVRLPPVEADALLASWDKWLARFLRKARDCEDVKKGLEKAFVLSATRAFREVYKRVPSEADRERGTAPLARKLNYFYSLTRDAYRSVLRTPAVRRWILATRTTDHER